MKSLIQTSFYAIIIMASIFYLSCDDAGIINNNSVSFTFNNLQTLDTSVDGMYEGWVYFPAYGYISIGKFNISLSGQPVDPNGNPLTFALKYKVPDVNAATGGLVTIVPPNGVDTFGTKLLAGAKTSNSEYVIFNVSMESDSILGAAATQYPHDTAQYMLCTPTDPQNHMGDKGIWFTKDAGGSSRSLSLSNIWGNPYWTYQAWVKDNPNARIYNIGRFSDPNGTDDFHDCKGSDPEFLKPGNDWITVNCPISSLNNGNYTVFITLEPKLEANQTNPFFIKLFNGNINVSGPGVLATITNVTKLPTAIIKIARN